MLYGSIERIPYGGYCFRLDNIKMRYYGYDKRGAEQLFRQEHNLRYKHIKWAEW